LNQGSKKSQKKGQQAAQENLVHFSGSGVEFEKVGKQEKSKTPKAGGHGKAAHEKVNNEKTLGESRSGQNQSQIDETAVHEQIKHTVDWKGKEERYVPHPVTAKHDLDRHSGTGRGREVPKEGHGKGGWGNIEEEARSYKGIHAEAVD